MPSSSKLPAFFNLVYKAVRTDSNTRRVRAFVMRLLIAAGRAPSPAFACATLILVSQVWKDLQHATAFVPEAHPTATNVISSDSTVTGTTTKHNDSDSDEEHFEDVPDDENEKKKASKPDKSLPPSAKAAGTWLHRSLRQASKPFDSEALTEPEQHPSDNGADPDSASVKGLSSGLFEGTRNPKFARDAELTYQHLLVRLTEHYHPSVAYFARKLLDTGEPLRFDGDVFEDFSLPAFLRRFVLKNPPKSRKQDAKAKRNMQNKRKRIALEASQQKDDKSGNAADEHLVRLFAEFDQQGALKRPRRRRIDGQEVTDSEFDDYLAKYDRKYLGPGGDEDGEDDEMDETLDFADDVRSKMEADELDRLGGAKKRKRKHSGSESDSENDSDDDGDENESDSEFDEEDYEDDEADEDEDLGADENTEDESDEELSPKPKRSRKGPAKKESLFADADEYAALIESDMNDNGYDGDDVDDAAEDEQLDEDEDDGSEEGQVAGKRRKPAKGVGRFAAQKRAPKAHFMKRRAGNGVRRPTKRF